ncbi:MAG: hypothetical protein J6O49_20095 [Bacteroidaceae bacterium]|nr:hypothetical protein [Bacteroidaceae bacterium]
MAGTTTVVENLQADSVNTTELYAGNMVVTGAARFANGIYGDLKNSVNINTVSSSATIPDTWTVIVSDGTAVHRISFADLCTAIAAKFGLVTGSHTYLTAD